MFEFNRFKSIEFPETNNIIETIKDRIDNGYYAILMLNQKYFQKKVFMLHGIIVTIG